MRPLKIALLVLLVSPAAQAGRALVEPPGIAKVVKSANRAEISRVLEQTKTTEICKDALNLAFDLLGVRCRAVVTSHLVSNLPIKNEDDLSVRIAYLKDLASAAHEVHTWAPLDPPPDLSKQRYLALRAIGEALMQHLQLLTIVDMKPELRNEVKDAACSTTQRAIDTSILLEDVSAAERGSLQALITGHRCFLDETRLHKAPKPGALDESADAKAIKASASDEGIIREYADTRALDLARCKKHLDAGNNVKDKTKLSECLCGAVQRWRLPPREKETQTTIAFHSVALPLSVDAHGAVKSCGPLP